MGCHCVHKKITQSCRVGIAWYGLSSDVSSIDVYDNESEFAGIARRPCTRPRPGKLNRELSQCERTCGHGNSGSVSQCGRRGGGSLATCEHFLESEKNGNSVVYFPVTKLFVLTLMLLKWQSEWIWNSKKGFNWGCRDTFSALLMTLEN